MKRGMALPVLVLAGILTFCLWNGAVLGTEVLRWRDQLRQAELLAEEENWAAVSEVLEASHGDWQGRQEYLRVVSGHGAVDEAEAMYRRCLAYARAEESSELRAELAGLREQLRVLAEMERFRVGNIL